MTLLEAACFTGQLANKKEKTERAGKKGSFQQVSRKGTLQNNHCPTHDLYWLRGLKKKKFQPFLVHLFQLFWFIDFCASKHSPLAKRPA